MLKNIRNAEAWLNTLDVNPVKLHAEYGMKGKKHFVEMLLSYQRIVEFYRGMPDGANDVDRVLKHVTSALRVVDDACYHDVGGADNKRFKEDVLSYLFACDLAKWFGFDNRFYLSEVKKILPRIYMHIPTRGVSPRMALIRRLGALGLPATDVMAQLVEKTLIRQRKPVAQMLKVDVYIIVHEIFHLTDSGRQPPHLLNAQDIVYLSDLLGELLHPAVLEDIDLLAEVAEAWLCLGMGTTETWRNVVSFIARRQNENGSFGSFEDARKQLLQQGSVYHVDVGMYLHTTAVCLNALARVSPVGQALKMEVESRY